jgi:hypothetical protein
MGEGSGPPPPTFIGKYELRISAPPGVCAHRTGVAKAAKKWYPLSHNCTYEAITRRVREGVMYVERFDRNLEITSMIIHLSIEEEDRLAFALLRSDPALHEAIFADDGSL